MEEKKRGWLRGDATDLYTILARDFLAGRPGVLVTVIGTKRSTPRHLGSKMIVHQDGTITGSIGGGRCEAMAIAEAAGVLAGNTCQRMTIALTGETGACGGELELFLEPIGQANPFWVIGAGHVGRAICMLGQDMSFHFHAVDDRAEFLTDLSSAMPVNAGPDELSSAIEITPGTVVLIASRSHELDGDYLAAVLQAERQAGISAAYLGVIGSRAKAARIASRFRDHPEYGERFKQVRMPVGLAIGAETPSEIAVSILADVLAVTRGVSTLNDEAGQQLGIYLHGKVPR